MAIGRIENPAQRLSDRLFWFQVTNKVLDAQTTSRLVNSFNGNPEAVAALNHDNALHLLFTAIKGDLNDAGVKLWVQALRAWHRVVVDDNYWSLTLSLEERGDFEPRALPSEIDALRDDAVRLAAEPFVASARDAVARNDVSTVRRISAAFEELKDSGSWAAKSLDDIALPVLEHFQRLCTALREESLGKIVQNNDAMKRNKNVCDAALNRFRTEAEPELRKTIELLAENSRFGRAGQRSSRRLPMWNWCRLYVGR